MENNLLSFWESVEKTDPLATKKVEYGSRKFTAIDAYTQIKNATAIWGEYGGKWGLKEMSSYVNGDYVFLNCIFYCPKGEFPYINNIKLGDDCMKKVITDTLTKCLSMLGFNADVFLGKFDDNKYVARSQSKNAAPVTNRNVGGGEVCDVCGSVKIPGKNNKTYCKSCYLKWAKENNQ